MKDIKQVEEKQIVGVVMDNTVDNQLPDYSLMTAEEAAEMIRQSQKTLVQRSALEAYNRPGFQRRWVTDIGNAIEERISQGYAPVREKDAIVNDGRIQQGTQMGVLAKKVVNPKHPSLGTHAVLMEIPDVIYNERQAKKAIKQKEIEERINPDLKEEARKAGIDIYGAGVGRLKT